MHHKPLIALEFPWYPSWARGWGLSPPALAVQDPKQESLSGAHLEGEALAELTCRAAGFKGLAPCPSGKQASVHFNWFFKRRVVYSFKRENLVDHKLAFL